MNKKNLIILFISIVIAMLGFGIALTVLPFFIEELGGGGTEFGVLMALFGLMQFLFAPVWGKVSDKHGRKTTLIIGIIGLGSAMLFFGLAREIWMLYAAQIASGILSSAVFPSAMAYVSDSSDEKGRSGAMGKIGSAAGLGVIIGPGIGGMMAGISYATPFFAAAGLCLITCLIVFFGLSESLTAEKKVSNIEISDIMEIKGVWQSVSTPLAFFLFAAFIANFGNSTFTSAYAFYSSARFNFGAEEVGTILMVAGLFYAIAQGVLVGPLTKKIGEIRVIKLSLLGGSVGFILMLLAFNFVTMLITVGFFVLCNALLKPATLAVISKRANTSQGSAMGLAESYMSLGRIIGPLSAGYFIDVNILYPYFSGAFIFMFMFVISFMKSGEQSV